MKKSIKKCVAILVMISCFFVNLLDVAYAGWHSDTDTRKVTWNNKKISIEVRYWMSELKTNFGRNKITFDATASSWVFVDGESNTYASNISKGHVLSVELTKYGLNGSLSVGGSAKGVTGSVSITSSSDNVATLTTPSRNTYYQGINAYNITVNRGVGGTICSWIPGVEAFTHGWVTGKATQSVTFGGDSYWHQTSVTNFYQ